MKYIILYFLFFFIYSIIGYVSEVLYVYIRFKKKINKGFLYGPYLPIYGIGALLVTYLLVGYYSDPIVVFIIGLIICSCLEYFLNYLLEFIFGNRWWDYSFLKYHVNGRICLKNAIIYGVGSLLVIYFFNPLINCLLILIPFRIQIYISIVVTLILIVDLIFSVFEAFRINNISNHLDAILNEYTKNRNIKLNKIKTRLFDAYPYLINNERVIKRLKKLKKDFKKSKKLQF